MSRIAKKKKIVRVVSASTKKRGRKKKEEEFSISMEEVTPAIANKWLSTNIPNNRPVKKSTVREYSRVMESGEWGFDATPIRFNKKGNLIDGQHRLEAVRSSKTTQNMLIVRGLDEESIFIADTGRSRTISDIFKIAGVRNYTIHSKAISLVSTWINGATEARFLSHSKKMQSREKLEFFQKNQAEFERCYKFLSSLEHVETKRFIGDHTLVAMMFYVINLEGESAREYIYTFMEDLIANKQEHATGRSNIPFVLRRKLVFNKDIPIKSSRRITSGRVNHLLLKCISEYKHGKDITNIIEPRTQNYFKLNKL